jgi:hypothetical protein
MCVNFMTLEYVSYIYIGATNQVRIRIYYSYIQANTWKFRWSYTPQQYSHISLFILTLFTKYSSRYYSLKILLMNNNTITENTSTIHYSYQCHFLPIKVRQWRPNK